MESILIMRTITSPLLPNKNIREQSNHSRMFFCLSRLAYIAPANKFLGITFAVAPSARINTIILYITNILVGKYTIFCFCKI